MKKILIFLFTILSLSVFGQTNNVSLPNSVIKLQKGDSIYTKNVNDFRKEINNEDVYLNFCDNRFPYFERHYAPTVRINHLVHSDIYTTAGSGITVPVKIADTVSLEIRSGLSGFAKLQLSKLNSVTNIWEFVSDNQNGDWVLNGKVFIPVNSINFTQSYVFNNKTYQQSELYRLEGFCDLSSTSFVSFYPTSFYLLTTPATAPAITTNTLNRIDNILESTVNGVTDTVDITTYHDATITGNGTVNDPFSVVQPNAIVADGTTITGGGTTTSPFVSVDEKADGTEFTPIAASSTQIEINSTDVQGAIGELATSIKTAETAANTHTVSNTSTVNTISTTVNGTTGTSVNIINSNTLTSSGNTITSTVNSVVASNTIAAETATQTPSNAIAASATQVSVPATNVQGAISNLATEVKNGQNDWKLGGNSNPTAQSIGTKNVLDFPIITSNAPRITVTAGGNVGVGTTAPVNKLHVINEGNSEYGIHIQNRGVSSIGDFTGISFGNFPNGGNLVLGAVKMSYDNPAATVNTSLRFFNAGNPTNVLSEKMTILSSGNIGINSVNPSVKLVVDGTDAIKGVSGTTGQRPVVPENGMFRYNTTFNKFEWYENNTWTTKQNSSRIYVKGINGVSANIAANTAINLLTAGDAGSDTFVASDFTTLPTIKEIDVWVNGVKAYRTTGTLATSAGTAYSITTAGVLTLNVFANQLEIKLSK